MNLLGITISRSDVPLLCDDRFPPERAPVPNVTFNRVVMEPEYVTENFAGIKCACFVAAVPCSFATQKSNRYFLNLCFQRKMKTFTSNCWQRRVRAHV